jgi:hypothetical protein
MMAASGVNCSLAMQVRWSSEWPLASARRLQVLLELFWL